MEIGFYEIVIIGFSSTIALHIIVEGIKWIIEIEED